MFHRLAGFVSNLVGSPIAFSLALGMVIGWGLAGPIFNYSQTWQLFINTTTTILTFLMLFLLQYTQNRDGQALQKKMDEVIRAIPEADNNLRELEKKSD